MKKGAMAARMRRDFLEAVWRRVEYWKREEREDWPNRLEGLAFSIMVLLDGMTDDAETAYRLLASFDAADTNPHWYDITEGAELHSELMTIIPNPKDRP